MRENLEPFKNKRIRITGIFDKFTEFHHNQQSKKVPTALFQELKLAETGEYICDHCYIQDVEHLKAISPKRGEIVECECRVMPYKRRLSNTNADGVMVETDYGLYLPTAIVLPERNAPLSQPKTFVEQSAQTPETPLDLEKPNLTVLAKFSVEQPKPEGSVGPDLFEAFRQIKKLGAEFGYEKLSEIIETLK